MLVHTAFSATAYKTRIAIVLKIGNLWVPEAELLVVSFADSLVMNNRSLLLANRSRSAR
jgi:hypothetical protein